MQKRYYAIETANQEPTYLRTTARRAQAALRSLHQQGASASLRKIHNKAEQRVAAEMMEAA